MPQHYGGLLSQIGRGLQLGAGVMNPEIFAQQQQERAQAKALGEQRKQALAQFILEAARGGQIPGEQAEQALKIINPEMAAQLPKGVIGPSVETRQALQSRAALDQMAERLNLPKGSPEAVIRKAMEDSGGVARVVSGSTPEGRAMGIPPGEFARVEGRIGPDGSFAPTKVLGRFGGSQTTINVGAGENAFAKESAKNLADIQSEVAKSGELAASTLPNLTQLSTLLGSGVQTGAVASSTLPLRAFARDLGVDVDSAAKAVGVDLGDVVSQEDFDRLSKRIIIDGFDKFKGNLNEKEVDLAINAFGNLGRTSEANISAIAAGMAAAQIAAEDGARAVQAQSSADVRQLVAERARRGTGRFMQLKKQYEEQIKARRQQAAPASGGPPPGAPIAESADGRRVYYDGARWVEF